jgi:PAS domain S-box-containing protein
LREDGHGNLWIVAGHGVNKFDPTTERFTRYRHDSSNPNSLSSNSVEDIAGDSRGFLWFGTADSGVDRFDPATETFTHYRNDSDGKFLGLVYRVIEDSHGEIWFVGERGLFHLSLRTGQITGPPGTIKGLSAGYLYEDGAGNFWMLAWSPIVGLVKYDRKKERCTEYPVGAGAAFIGSSRLLDDGENGLWVPSSLGLFYFDLRTERFTYHFRHDETNPDSLNDNAIVQVYRDRAGLLWVATEHGGLNILNFQQEQFGRWKHRPGDPNSLSPGRVSAIYLDSDNVLWLGFFPRALDRLDRKAGRITHYVPDPKNRNALSKGAELTSICEDTRGYLWLGGWQAGLDRYDKRAGQFKHYGHNPNDPASLMSDNVLSLYEDRSSHLWVGQTGGVSRFDPAMQGFVNYRTGPGSLYDTVSAIYQDRSGMLWLGKWDGVVSRLDTKTKALVNYTPDSSDPHKLQGGSISVIYEDRAGTLWVGSETGVCRYNRQNETFTCYAESQDLPSVSNNISGLLEDGDGRLRLSTKNGISRFNPKTEMFRHYDTADGLQSNEFRDRACARGPDGEMFFGGDNGMTTFFPQDIRDNPYAPPIVLTSFKIFNKPVPIGAKSILKKSISDVDALTLSYRYNVFSFEFAALSYANSQKNRYRYKLEGLEPGWNEVGSKQRLATYTNLDPGKYVFRVQASNSDGVWNEEGVSLPILITPPWWRTNWFRALCAAAFLALLWAAYQLRVRQLLRQERKFRDVIETIPGFAWTARPDGSIDFANRHWLEYSGLSSGETAGSGWEVAVHEADFKQHTHKWRASIEKGAPFENEVRFRRVDGQYRWFLVRGVPLRDGRGKIVKWYGTSTDIEDRKRAEQLQTDLAHVNRVSMLGELAASIAHEVNQPLAGIVSGASASLRWLTRDVPNVEEACAVARNIVRDGKQAGEIIHRLRSLYKKTPPKRELIDVNEIIGEMVVMLRAEANRFAVSIRTDLAADLPEIMADGVQLQQVLMNLMLNGIESMHDTGGVLTVKSQPEDGYVLISVSDTGVGLPTDEVDRIFDAFYTTKPQGSGMGLAISRSIIESHQGRIWATANDGRGASFHFSLPAAVRVEEAPAAGV